MKRQRTQRTQQIETIVPRPARTRRTSDAVYCESGSFYEPAYVGGRRMLRLPSADDQARMMRDGED